MNLYAKAGAVIAAYAVLIGIVIPSLISFPGTLAFTLGLFLLFFTPMSMFFAARWLWRDKLVQALVAKLRNVAPLLLLVAVAPMFGGCERWSVPAGNVLVVVNKYGDNKGVDDTEVRGPGRYWLTYNQEGHLFPTFVQSPKWTADKGDDYKDQGFSCTVSGMSIGLDIGAQYEFVPSKIPVIFSKYRRGADELSDTVIRQLVADALTNECGSISVEDAYGKGRESLLNNVQARVAGTLEPIGVRVLTLNWLGKPRLPESIVESINAKIAATQKAEQRANEVAQAEAQANIDRAKARGDADATMTRAKAEASANDLISKSLTPELVRYRALDRWNGELPRINGAGAVPFVDVGAEAKK